MRRRHCIALLAACVTGGLLRPSRAAAAPVRLLVLGDSLSAEYGMPRGTGWVALLDKRLQQQGRAATVINASISGETTAGGRSRLPALLKQHQPTHLIIELSGNDALRGFAIEVTEANLRWMARTAREAGVKVMIAAIQIPPNYGARYMKDFDAMFVKVARDEKTALVPSFLAGVADDPEPLRWFQPDRTHPTEQAQPLILENVWRVLRPWIWP